MSKPIADSGKAFRTSFDRLCYRRNWHDAFRDFIEIAACTIHQQPYHLGLLEKDEDYERIEELYLSTIKKYNREEIDQIVALYGISVIALRSTQEDFLGEQYMQLEISNKHNGEFFSPSNISRMMAKIQMSGIGELIKAKGYVTLQEPACGAGVMVIEAANALRDEGHDPRCTMLFQAIDINRTCFNMAYFQLAALELPGVVIHGDTLRMEHWDKRSTPQWKLMQQHGVSGNLLPAFELPPRPEPAPQIAMPPPQQTAQFMFEF